MRLLWLALPLLLPLGAHPADAAVFRVDTLADDTDGLVGDGRCASSTARCTLRAALEEANARTGPDTVELTVEGVYALSSTRSGVDDADTGDLDIYDSVTLSGLGPTRTVIDGFALPGRPLLDIDRRIELQMEAADRTQAAAWSPTEARLSNETTRVSQGDGSIELFARDFRVASMGFRLGVIRNWSDRVLLIDVLVPFPTYLSETQGVRVLLSSEDRSRGFTHFKFWDFGSRQIEPGVFTTLAIDVGGPATGEVGSPDMTRVRAIALEANHFRPLPGRRFYFDHARLLSPAGSEPALPAVEITAVGFQRGGIAIRNRGQLTLRNVMLVENTLGLRNEGRLEASEVEARDNFGGAFHNAPAGEMTLQHSRIVANLGGNLAPGSGSGGAGVRNEGTLRIEETLLERNTATHGAALFNAASGSADVRRSTFTRNVATHGGALWNDGGLALESSTVSQNRAEESGGGLLNRGLARLAHVTLARNTSGGPGPAIATPAGSVRLAQSALSGNVGSAGLVHCSAPVLVSEGGNVQQSLEGVDACGLDLPGDTIVENLALSALADNGGPTRTHRPKLDSPVIDHSPATACQGTDQRGIPRPIDGDGDGAPGCDAGAVEFEVDPDGDGRLGPLDNCPAVSNPDQADTDADGFGDACECGDFDGNGLVDTSDSRLLQRCAVGEIPCSGLCDANGDGLCNTSDARLVQRLAVDQLAKRDLRCDERP